MENAKGIKFSVRLEIGFVLSLLIIVVLTIIGQTNFGGLAGGPMSPENGRFMIISAVIEILLLAGLGLMGYFLFIRPFGMLYQAVLDMAEGKGLKKNTLIEEYTSTRTDEFAAMSQALLKVEEAHQEEVFWFESILDAIPFPLSVTDLDMNWTFINKPVEQMLKLSRKDVLGKHCSNWQANICKTENCGVARLRKNFLSTFFDQMGGNFRVDSSFLVNLKGEKIGHVEAVQEITPMVATSKYQEAAIQQLSSYLNQMSQGVLNFDIQELPAENQHTREARKNFISINEMLKTAREMLRKAIQSVILNAEKVSEASEQLAASSNQAGNATSQIAVTIQRVAKGTAQQSEAVNLTVSVIDDVNKSISLVSSGAEDQTKAIRKASVVTEKITANNGISARVELSAQKAQELGSRSQQIGAIIETIDDIASQTNLLALNAAIEAARAGEHGKGFAVVADEVRKLAERSSAATKEISQLIKGIQSNVAETVEMSATAATEINSASGELTTAIESLSNVLDDNDKATHELTGQSSQMIQSMENIASVSEENSAAVEEVSAAAEEMTAQVEEVSAAAQALSQMASELKESVAGFSV
jgi:methyl-accepting chemotaxis protein